MTPDAYAVEARLLKEKLSALYGLEVVDKAPVTIALETLADKAKAVNDEYYDLVKDSDRIKISAATPHGVFNGIRVRIRQSHLAIQHNSAFGRRRFLYRRHLLGGYGRR